MTGPSFFMPSVVRRQFLVVVFLIISFLSLAPLGASPVRSFGYGLSAIGKSGISHPESTMGGIGLSLAYAPFSFPWFEPSLKGEVVAGNTSSGFSLRFVRAAMGFDLFRTLRHPFSVMTNNPSAWSVSLDIGVQFDFDRMDELPKLYLACTPIKLEDKDFWYEWCAPYLTLDCSDGGVSIDSWGFVLFRFTYLVV